MIPNEPPRPTPLGYLYIPPIRVQGISIAGEETVIQVPEYDVCFDIGRAPRIALASSFVALSHGHMDHAAGLAYYFSQRHFQGMGTGTVLCHKALEGPIQRLMRAWVDIEAQNTPYNVVAMDPADATAEFELKNNLFLRAFYTDHTVPSLGFVVFERRFKLKPELLGQPQEKLLALKNAGQEITYSLEIPHVAYMGDTGPGEHFARPDVQNARVLITECTFLDPDHQDRAKVGKHLHLEDLINVLRDSHAQSVVITHLSRRTHLGEAMAMLHQRIPAPDRERLMFLMDTRHNRQRLAEQMAKEKPAEKSTENPEK